MRRPLPRVTRILVYVLLAALSMVPLAAGVRLLLADQSLQISGYLADPGSYGGPG